MSIKSKICELDPIPTMLLKDMQPILLLYLTEIINKILTEGMFIERWKTAIVSPRLKKSGLELIKKTYKPVGSLLFPTKVVERCIPEQFNLHCTEFNLLSDFQSGYRHTYSIETETEKKTGSSSGNTGLVHCV